MLIKLFQCRVILAVEYFMTSKGVSLGQDAVIKPWSYVIHGMDEI
jgi:hypothetical protein